MENISTFATNSSYGNGIVISSGFDLGAKSPLDSRIIVNTIEERDLHVTENRAYEGIVIFVNSDKKTYQLVNNTWEEFGFNETKLQPHIEPIIANVSQNKSDIDKLKTDVAAVDDKITNATSEVVTTNKSYTDTKIANLVNSSPETLDTLNELALALNNDPNFATTVTSQIGLKADKTYVDAGLSKKSDIHEHNYKPSDYAPAWTEITGKPNSYTPSSHIHKIADISDFNVHTHDSLYATKASEHNHTNKIALDTISAGKITTWDSKSDFDGNYSSLSNKPSIPSKVSQLTNDSGFITGSDVDTSQNHTHTNKSVLDIITSIKTTEWDNKSNFDGDYRTLSNKPVIPSKVSQLTNDTGFITMSDVDTSQNHIHNNKTVLDSITSTKVTEWNAKETTVGAQDKADGAFIASKAYTDTKVADLVDSAPETMNTLKELATAITSHGDEYGALLSVVGGKAESSYVNSELAKKANVDYVTDMEDALTGQINSKANKEHLHVASKVQFENDQVTIESLGGVKVGESLQGLTVEQILSKLLFKHVNQIVSGSSSPNGGVFEIGTTQVVTSITANVTKKTNPITKIEYLDGATLIKEKITGVSNGGTFAESGLSLSVTSNKNFQVRATANGENGQPLAISANTGSFTFVYPYYWGLCQENSTINEGLIKGLDKKVEIKANKSVTVTSNNQRVVFAYPKTYGIIKQILDPNNFDVTGTFSRSEILVTGLDSNPQPYYVYVNSAFSASNFIFRFNY